MSPQNTSLVTITQISVVENNTPVQVVTGLVPVQLAMTMTIDQSLIGNGFRWDLCWQVVEVATSHVQSINWSSNNFGQQYPLLVDNTFANGGGEYTFVIQETTDYFGVHAGEVAMPRTRAQACISFVSGYLLTRQSTRQMDQYITLQGNHSGQFRTTLYSGASDDSGVTACRIGRFKKSESSLES